jgi:lipopolysaccharide biosynthesis regulator YciM
MRPHHAASFALLLCLAACAPGADESAPQESDPAITQLKQEVAADTTRWEPQLRLAAELRRKNRHEEAAQAAERAFMLAPSPATEARLEMAKVYAAAERSASAINLVKEVEKKKREGIPADEVKIAEVYAVLGDPNSVFRWLTRAVEAKSPNVAGLKTNPDLTSVHDDPRWQEIVGKLP